MILNSGCTGESPRDIFYCCFLYICVYIYIYIYFYLCWVFVAACGLSLVVVHGLLTAVVSLVKCRLYACGLQ